MKKPKFVLTQLVKTYASGDRDTVIGWSEWENRDATHICSLTEGVLGFVVNSFQANSTHAGYPFDEWIYLVSFNFGRFLYIAEMYLDTA